MEPIRATTQKLIRDWSSKRQNREEGVVKNNLKQFFTRQEQRHITKLFFRGARLIMNVDSSAWLYQLNLKKEQLLQYLNQTLEPHQAIAEILLQLDRDEAKSET